METSRPDRQWSQLRVYTPTLIVPASIVIAVASAVVLRWFHLGQLSLWWDEGFTAWGSSLSPADVVRFARNDNQPPLYYLLLHYWEAVVGNSEYALRGFSAFFGTLSLPVFYLLAKKVLKDSVAVALAMWLFAFSVKQIWYSREGRAYELASFLALVGLYALVLFLERRSAGSFATIVVSATASLYVHNMMFFYLFALDVMWLIYPSERSWTQRLKELLLANILAALLYLPWALSLFAQVAAVSGNLWWVPRPSFWTLVGTLRDLGSFEMPYLFAVASRLSPLSATMTWVCVVGAVEVLCLALLAGGLWGVPKAERGRNMSLLLYCLLPILVVFVLSQKILPLYLDRVFTASSVVVPIVFAFPLALERGPRGRIVYGFLGLVLAATTALSAVGFLRYREAREKINEDWRGATSRLLRIPEGNRLIVFVPPGGEILFDYYARRSPAIDPRIARIGLPTTFYDQFPPPKARLVDAREINRLKLALGSNNYSEIDLVLAHDVDPQGLLLDYLDRDFVRQEDLRSYGILVTILRFLALPHGESLAGGSDGRAKLRGDVEIRNRGARSGATPGHQKP